MEASGALPEGCWPTMITPFTPEGKIDYPVVEALIGTCLTPPPPADQRAGW